MQTFQLLFIRAEMLYWIGEHPLPITFIYIERVNSLRLLIGKEFKFFRNCTQTFRKPITDFAERGFGESGGFIRIF